MIDFKQYVVSELKSKRLSKTSALELLKQFYREPREDSGRQNLHPLLHRNTSDLMQQNYSSRFDGREFFLNDHQVLGQKILPGVAYLEMVRAAVEDALPEGESAQGMELRNVVWASPVVVNSPQDVHVALFPSDTNSQLIDYEVYSLSMDAAGEPSESLHSQGQVDLSVGATPNALDLSALTGRMTAGRYQAAEIYRAYQTMGLHYGTAHKGIQQILRGEGELLAHLRLPQELADTQTRFLLHPSLMDSAIQSPIGFLKSLDEVPTEPSLPFAIASIKIHRSLSRDMIAWVRFSDDSRSDQGISKVDIDLCDHEGQVAVEIRGFSSRVLGTGPELGEVYASRQWRDAEPTASEAADIARRQLWSWGLDKHPDNAERLSVDATENSAQQYNQLVIQCIDKLKSLLSGKLREKTLVQLALPNDYAGLWAGVEGLFKTAALENPLLDYQLILLDDGAQSDDPDRLLSQEAGNPQDKLLRHQGGRRQVLITEMFDVAEDQPLPLKADGVYLISGGLGGLGRLFAQDIIAQCPRAKVVLTGRSPLNKEQEDFIAGLNNLHYRQMDLSIAESVQSVVDDVLAQFGALHGIIHTAGAVADDVLIRKTPDESLQVLLPKTVGTVHLDAASQAIELDFIALFSSVSSVFGNLGQADYAAANGFMDHFAAYRNSLTGKGERQGKTLSINWPLWQTGGMKVAAATEQAIAQTSGMYPMSSETGLLAFRALMNSNRDSALVMHGHVKNLQRLLLPTPIAPVSEAQTANAEKPSSAAINQGELAERSQEYLRQHFSTVLKLPADRIDPHAALEKYGIDSILAMNITSHLEQSFGSLPKTLFFEYQSIAELNQYFLDQHQEQLQTLLKVASNDAQAASTTLPSGGASTANTSPMTAVDLPTATPRRRRSGSSRATVALSSRSNEAIAIVGLSGRYPQSPDVQAFWENLEQGRDCITEVPESRWDWREYYSEDRLQEGHHFSKWGGFIEGVDEFDPRFFNISPREAEIIDPQERLFLQHSWMAIEDAGLTRESLQVAQENDLAGQVGVYAGVMYSEYQLFGAEANALGKPVGVPGSFASIANRVSYTLNLHGPSMTLDTMCSSSLTAIHLACQDLREGRTDFGIAGGVNISIHPSKYFVLSAGQYISTTGACQSFGEGGDGYIPGEGVGVVVLRRLSDAERDGNHIYGLIRGSALNHGGKTNGYSVPNLQAQASVIARALKEADIDPRHVSYLEAHGTGTTLGDPIEINALARAFYGEGGERNTGYCLLGSAKSNIGHCESAAGIAGLTKVLLQMKHRKIVPSLHSATLNPHIDFDKTPFVVNQTLRDWDAPVANGKTLPRIAGLSSFGAGGSNAHLLIEEYIAPPVETSMPAGEPRAIVLSARNDERLLQKVKDLLTFIDREPVDLQSLAYTLQRGREPMEQRLALTVNSLDELKTKLGALAAGDTDVEGCYRGSVDADQDQLSVLRQDEDMLAAVQRWVERRKYSRLLEFWVKGLELDWSVFYTGTCRLVSLPTYPFARERYWVDGFIGPLNLVSAQGHKLHPLLQQNTSRLDEQSYRSHFTGSEYFLADHQVVMPGRQDAAKVLPAVAYLEMARAAIAHASGELPEDYSIALGDIVWMRPLVVSRPTDVSVRVEVEGEDSIFFQILDEDLTVYCEGRASFYPHNTYPHNTYANNTAATVDLDALLKRCGDELKAAELYDSYRGMGIHYGESFRSVAHVHCGDNEVLAELLIPTVANISTNMNTSTDVLLPPPLLDGALQAALGLVSDRGSLSNNPILPFALDEVRLLSPCTGRMRAWIRYAEGGGHNESLIRLDIDLIDEQGRVCVQLRGLTSRVMDTNLIQPATEVLFASPEWEPQAPVLQNIEPATKLLLFASPELDGVTLHAALSSVAEAAQNVETEILMLNGEALSALHDGQGYRQLALQIFEHMKVLLTQQPKTPVVVQFLLATSDALALGLVGLLKTVAMENPRVRGQIILMDDFQQVGERTRESLASGDQLIRYLGGQREVLSWKEQGWEDNASAYRNTGGVYLITGGTGGLGLTFAGDILATTDSASVILTGRAPLSDESQQLANSLSSDRHRVVYRQLTLNDLDELTRSVADIEAEFGGITGVIHSAGMTADNFLVKKTAEEFEAVLEPKVIGTINLDRATQSSPLDFFVLFSSASAALGNPGQSDYAAANGFMDQFAYRRNQELAQGGRAGHTLSINWPIWETGGMVMDEAALAILKTVSGVVPMQSATGLKAFHQSLSHKLTQALVMEGNLTKMRATLFPQPASDVSLTRAVESSGENVADDLPADLTEKIHYHLKHLFAEALKLSADEIDPKARLENYGIDSVIAMKLTAELEAVFGTLSKTLFFEYQSIVALADYLISDYPDRACKWVGADKPSVTQFSVQESNSLDSARVKKPVGATLNLRRKSAVLPGGTGRGPHSIAIVGVAGRYPEAEDLNAFWSNLKAGRDSITEIPTDRWDNELFFDPRRNQLGKTYSKWGGFVPDADKFDPLFFNISPREAEFIDPQERLFMQTAWHTFEDAGYTRDALAGRRIGVYVGVMWGHYELYGADALAQGNMHVPGSSYASIANRVSYFYDLRGPSLALDTMCSSSLTAIHLACEAIRNGDIEAALAGGVNLSLHPQKYINLSQGNFSASDGRCRSFGEGGDGYVPGEGVGAVVLKGLDQARQEGDRIYAVIKATALNHGGKTNGYTVPNPLAQGELIEEALNKAGIEANTLSYIETHGTGTALGDPIEINGLNRAFGKQEQQQFCAIGSVKSNIGHLESAAGIAAITKVLLQFKHRQLVPSLHAEPLNPNIDFQQSPFYVQQALEAWEGQGNQPRRAGVSSFGAGGSNAHIILEEYVERAEATLDSGEPEAILLSARDMTALENYVAVYRDFLIQASDIALADLAYTTQLARTPMKCRLAIIARDKDELLQKLEQWQATQQSGVFLSDDQSRNSTSSLLGGEAGKTFLSNLMQARDLDRLLSLWVNGVDIDWTQVTRRAGRKVELPLYPFEKERYWIQTSGFELLTKTQPGDGNRVSRSEQPTLMYYQPIWKAQPIKVANRLPAGNLLVINPIEGLIDALKSGKNDEQFVVSAVQGNHFVDQGKGNYQLNLSSGDQMETFIAALDSHAALPQNIVWCLSDNTAPENVFLAHLALFKALMTRRHYQSLHLLALSLTDDNPLPEHSALSGLYKTLAIENPKYAAKIVQLPASAASTIASAVLTEFAESNWRDQAVRLDAGERRVRRLVPVAAITASQQSMPLKQDGVYLISGGLGGLGFIFAQYLAREFKARLILLGRSQTGADQRDKLASLEHLGGQALYVQADVSQSEDVSRALHSAREKFGAINGVFHSAGSNRDAFLRTMSADDASAVLSPKVQGTLNLDAATKEDQLDLFVLFSSTASVTGNPGQGDYAFANHYLDSFSARREQQRVTGERYGKTLSINWPYWADGGMHLSTQQLRNLQEATGMVPLDTATGLAAWEAAVQADADQMAVLFGLASKITAQLEQPTPVLAAAAPSQSRALSAPALVSSTFVSSTLAEQARRYLQGIVGDEINLPAERLDENESVDSFGIDSVVISRITARMEADLGEVSKTLFYEYQTIAELVNYLLAEKPQELAAALNLPLGDSESDVVDYPVMLEPQTPMANARPGTTLDVAEPIAIIGLHASIPQSENLNEYWDNLKHGRDLVRTVPLDRWDAEALYDPDPERAADGKLYCKWGAFLDDVDCFDASFFNISAAEARMMDPQERLFLQSVWSAFENAGYTRERLKQVHPKGNSANIGVFVGVTTNSYQLLGSEQWQQGNMVNPASLPWSIANRVSYYFDLQGPSMPVDTACSSALVAIDLACQSLQRGECQAAVAGGVNLYLHPAKYLSLCQRQMISHDGTTRSFAAGEDGFVPAEAVGALILKPLSRAEQDGDYIHAVLRASGYEHAGRSNGYTAPNPNSMASLIENTLLKADLHPRSISYVEGHGTGTQLGDSLEISAMTKVFSQYSNDRQFCAVASMKSNMGHPEAAAGIAGIAKILLQLKHRQLAPSLHAERQNPNIDFDNSPFYLQRELADWSVDKEPRRALINASGSGGVNACAVIEEYKQASSSANDEEPGLFILSARDGERLQEYAADMASLIETESYSLQDVCYSVQTGRDVMSQRLAIVAASRSDLIAALKQFDGNHNLYVDEQWTLETDANITSDEGLAALLTSSQWQGVARHWLSGGSFDWAQLNGDTTARRVPLATYPFAKQSHWLTESRTASLTGPRVTNAIAAQIHPLVGSNTSTLREVSFTSQFLQSEYYATEHKVNGSRLLPGSAFIEMAYIAGSVAGEARVQRIKDIVWMQPLIFGGDDQTVQIHLKPVGDATEYLISSVQNFDSVPHTEGRLVFEDAETVIQNETIDLDALFARCTRSMNGDEFYRATEEYGFQYQGGFRSIHELHLGDGFALTRLELATRETEEYILHPCLLDGAFQSVSALISEEQTGRAHVPFAIDEVIVFGSIPPSCYVHVKRAESSSSEMKYDIFIINAAGSVVVSIKGFYVRPLPLTAKRPVSKTAADRAVEV